MARDLTVTISGSYNKHLDRILAARAAFEALGVTVLRPHTDQVASVDGDVVRLEGDPAEVSALRAAQFAAIERSGLVYVVNPGGYVGPSANVEVGYAHRAATPVFCAEPAFEHSVADLASGVGNVEHAVAFMEARN